MAEGDSMKDIIEKLGIKSLGSFTVDGVDKSIKDQLFCFADLVREIEQQRDEMLEALIDFAETLSTTFVCPSFRYTAWGKRLLPVIEKATGKTWEEIKEILNARK